MAWGREVLATMGLWLTYVLIVTALTLNNGDLAFSIALGLYLLLVLWPLAFPMQILYEIVRHVFKGKP